MFLSRVMKAHYHAEKHTKKNSVECTDCGQVFKGSSSGGLLYHRSLNLPLFGLYLFCLSKPFQH